MAHIKFEVEMDSTRDLDLFTKLLAAFSGEIVLNVAPTKAFTESPSVQSITITEPSPVEVTAFDSKEIYSEEKLREMDNSSLKDLATGMGIDWASEDGKNTNAKLVKLILRKYEEFTKEEDTEQSEDTVDVVETKKEESVKDSPAESELTLNDLKLELGIKVEDNRDAIVKKLTELGASKLTNLDATHYPVMMDFLKSR